jgi:hypothetical protein
MSAMMMPGEGVDAMAMQEMMGGAGGLGMESMGGEDEIVPVMVPAWCVPAVEELVDLLMASDEAEMSGGGDMGMNPGMGGMPAPMM